MGIVLGMGAAATRAMTGVALAVAAYGVWLAITLSSEPSEGSNIGGGMAVMGAGAAVLAVGLGAFAIVKQQKTGGPAAAGLAFTVVALMFLALPTLALLFPDM